MVEVVVALTVLSLIMLATVSGFRTLGNTQTTINERIGRVEEIRAVSSFLRDAVGAAVMGSGSGGLSLGGDPEDMTYFELTDDGALLWRARVLFGEAFGGSYLLRLALEKGVLTLRWREFGQREPGRGWNKAPSKSLVGGVDVFELAYRRETGGAWQETWDQRGAPGWLRVRLRAGDRFWPDLVMVVGR